MISTAMPRAQSMYGRRRLERGAAVSISGLELKRHLEIDVLPHRMPHRTVLVARELDGAFDSGCRRASLDRQMDCRGDDAMGNVGGAICDEAGSEGPKRVAPLCQRVGDIHGHAAAQRGRQEI